MVLLEKSTNLSFQLRYIGNQSCLISALNRLLIESGLLKALPDRLVADGSLQNPRAGRQGQPLGARGDRQSPGLRAGHLSHSDQKPPAERTNDGAPETSFPAPPESAVSCFSSKDSPFCLCELERGERWSKVKFTELLIRVDSREGAGGRF